MVGPHAEVSLQYIEHTTSSVVETFGELKALHRATQEASKQGVRLGLDYIYFCASLAATASYLKELVKQTAGQLSEQGKDEAHAGS